MEENSSNGNNTNPGYVPLSHASPLLEAISPFYPVENTYPPVFPGLHQENYTPFNVTYPQVPPEQNQGTYTPFSVTFPQVPPEINQGSYTPISVTYPPILPETHQESYTPFSITYPPILPETHQESYTPFSITYPPILPETKQEIYTSFNVAYPPTLSETHQGICTPINVNQNNNPSYVFEPTGLNLVPGHPTNYLLDTIMDTSAIISHTDFKAHSEHSISQDGTKVPHKVTFQCKKCPAEFHSSHAFGGHMSYHAKLTKKFENPQTMMATLNKSKHAASISGVNEGHSESGPLPQKKRGRKKGKGVITDEQNSKVKKQA